MHYRPAEFDSSHHDHEIQFARSKLEHTRTPEQRRGWLAQIARMRHSYGTKLKNTVIATAIFGASLGGTMHVNEAYAEEPADTNNIARIDGDSHMGDGTRGAEVGINQGAEIAEHERMLRTTTGRLPEPQIIHNDSQDTETQYIPNGDELNFNIQYGDNSVTLDISQMSPETLQRPGLKFVFYLTQEDYNNNQGITADIPDSGKLVLDEDTQPELFHLFRGGNQNFYLVTTASLTQGPDGVSLEQIAASNPMGDYHFFTQQAEAGTEQIQSAENTSPPIQPLPAVEPAANQLQSGLYGIVSDLPKSASSESTESRPTANAGPTVKEAAGQTHPALKRLIESLKQQATDDQQRLFFPDSSAVVADAENDADSSVNTNDALTTSNQRPKLIVPTSMPNTTFSTTLDTTAEQRLRQTTGTTINNYERDHDNQLPGFLAGAGATLAGGAAGFAADRVGRRRAEETSNEETPPTQFGDTPPTHNDPEFDRFVADHEATIGDSMDYLSEDDRRAQLHLLYQLDLLRSSLHTEAEPAADPTDEAGPGTTPPDTEPTEPNEENPDVTAGPGAAGTNPTTAPTEPSTGDTTETDSPPPSATPDNPGARHPETVVDDQQQALRLRQEYSRDNPNFDIFYAENAHRYSTPTMSQVEKVNQIYSLYKAREDELNRPSLVPHFPSQSDSERNSADVVKPTPADAPTRPQTTEPTRNFHTPSRAYVGPFGDGRLRRTSGSDTGSRLDNKIDIKTGDVKNHANGGAGGRAEGGQAAGGHSISGGNELRVGDTQATTGNQTINFNPRFEFNGTSGAAQQKDTPNALPDKAEFAQRQQLVDRLDNQAKNAGKNSFADFYNAERHRAPHELSENEKAALLFDEYMRLPLPNPLPEESNAAPPPSEPPSPSETNTESKLDPAGFFAQREAALKEKQEREFYEHAKRNAPSITNARESGEANAPDEFSLNSLRPNQISTIDQKSAPDIDYNQLSKWLQDNKFRYEQKAELDLTPDQMGKLRDRINHAIEQIKPRWASWSKEERVNFLTSIATFKLQRDEYHKLIAEFK